MEELLGGALRTEGAFRGLRISLCLHTSSGVRVSQARGSESGRPLGFSLSTLYIQVTAELYGLPRAPGGVGIALTVASLLCSFPSFSLSCLHTMLHTAHTVNTVTQHTLADTALDPGLIDCPACAIQCTSFSQFQLPNQVAAKQDQFCGRRASALSTVGLHVGTANSMRS